MKKFRLYKYQRRWINDQSRMKICLKARQIGFTTALCFEAVQMALDRRQYIIILSTSERQSTEVLERIKSILYAFKKMKVRFPRETRSEVVFPNGSKIVALPASPGSIRGYTGHVFLDEFAFHRDAKEIWRAVMPIASRGYKIRVISTPAGKSGKFYEIWDNASQMGFSAHKVDIYDAIKDGLKIDLAALKAAMDPDDFAQEYECVFLDEAHSYFPMEMIIDAVSAECDRWDGKPRGMFYAGVDIGRRKDLTVIYLLERLGDVYYTRTLDTLHKTPFDAQQAAIERVISDYPVRRLCIDSTGIGMQIAERLQKKFSSLVEPVTFTLKVKEDLATYTRMMFEKRLVRIPDDQDLFRDIHSIKKIITPAGNVRFDSDRNERSHADRFWAMALALHAANDYSGPFTAVTRQRRESVQILEGY